MVRAGVRVRWGRLIRPFAADDQTSLITTIDTVCGESRWMSTRRFEPTPAWTHALVQPDCPRHLLLVVGVDEAIMGWCRLFPTDLCNGAPPQVSLGIGLLQPYRDMGIGTALACEALEWASLNGVQSVILSTRPDNTRAIHVFKKCGFSTTGYMSGNLLAMQWESCFLHNGASDCRLRRKHL